MGDRPPPDSCPECYRPFCGSVIPAELCEPCERAGFTIASRKNTKPLRRPSRPTEETR